MEVCSAMHLNLENFRGAEEYCDVRVRVQNKKFSCHRLLLASVSEYFHALFGGKFKVKDGPETALEDIDAEAFDEILRCIYTGQTCRITPSNIFNLLAASVYLRISSVEGICTKYILENISLVPGHVPMFAFVRAMNVTALTEAVSEYIANHFASFYDDETLVEVAFDDLVFLLNKWSQNKSPFKEQDIMLHFLIRWVLHDMEERRKYFMELTAMVNFEKISTAYVAFVMPFFEYFTDRPSADLEEMMTSLNLSSPWKEKCNHTLPFKNCHDEGDVSENGVWLKEKLFKNFADSESLSVNLEQEMPASFHSRRFYGGHELGLHIHVAYFTPVYFLKKFEGTQVLSYSKYRRPSWFVSGETDKWHRCVRRMSAYLEATNSLYCLEYYEDEHDARNSLLQKFCFYSDLDSKSNPHVMSPPPVALADCLSASMCVTPQSDVYLSASYGFGGYNPLPDAGAYYRYDSGVDEWFPISKGEEYWDSDHPCLAAHNNVIYSISGSTKQAYDHRSGRWMKLPLCNRIHRNCVDSHSCVLNDKVFVWNDGTIQYYDTVGGKWVPINRPREFVYNRHRHHMNKMLNYENSLLFLYYIDDRCDNGPDYQVDTFSTTSNEWYVCDKSLRRSIFETLLPMKSHGVPRIIDMFKFRT